MEDMIVFKTEKLPEVGRAGFFRAWVRLRTSGSSFFGLEKFTT
jgi:hypothetical protein